MDWEVHTWSMPLSPEAPPSSCVCITQPCPVPHPPPLAFHTGQAGGSEDCIPSSAKGYQREDCERGDLLEPGEADAEGCAMEGSRCD